MRSPFQLISQVCLRTLLCQKNSCKANYCFTSINILGSESVTSYNKQFQHTINCYMAIPTCIYVHFLFFRSGFAPFKKLPPSHSIGLPHTVQSIAMNSSTSANKSIQFIQPDNYSMCTRCYPLKNDKKTYRYLYFDSTSSSSRSNSTHNPFHLCAVNWLICTKKSFV